MPVGPGVPPATGVLPPQGPCPSPGLGLSPQGCPCRASTASATKRKTRDQGHKQRPRPLSAAPCPGLAGGTATRGTLRARGPSGVCATGCSATAVGALGQLVGVGVGHFHGWGGWWVPGRRGRHVLPAAGGRCWLRRGPPSICVSAAERGTVMRLFLTGWGGRRGLVPPWLYH